MTDFVQDVLMVKLRSWDPEVIQALVDRCGGVLVDSMPAIKWIRVEVSPAEVADVFRRYEQETDLVADVTIPIKVDPHVANYTGCNDAMAPKQYALQRMNVPAAWKYTRGFGVRAGVLDTGLYDWNDQWPEFFGKDLIVWDVFNNRAEGPGYDQHFVRHGTQCCATIGGRHDKNVGPVGVAPEAALMSNRVFTLYGWTDLPWLAAGITQCVDKGCKVISVSIGGGSTTVTQNEFMTANGYFVDAVNYASEHDVLIFFSAGNGGKSEEQHGMFTYPAAVMHQLGHVSVGCTSHEEIPDRPVWYTDHGASTTIASPGHCNWTPYRNYRATDTAEFQYPWASPHGNAYTLDTSRIQYDFIPFNGTSSACPLAAAVAVLVWAINPDLTYTQVRQILMDTADKPQHPEFAQKFVRPGCGIVNAGRAVTKAYSMRADVSGPVPYVNFFGQGVSLDIGVAPIMHLRGTVQMELHGFDKDNQITNVKAWAGTDLIYDGPPVTSWDTLVPVSSSFLFGKAFKIQVSTATVTGPVVTLDDVVGHLVSSTPPRTRAEPPGGDVGGNITLIAESENLPVVTRYRWGEGAWQTYAGPIAVQPGRLSFYSKDANGNIEGGVDYV